MEDQGDGWCRVYYSADTALPNFIPKFAKDKIINIGVKRSTSWVNTRCNEVTGSGGGKKGSAESLHRLRRVSDLIYPTPHQGLSRAFLYRTRSIRSYLV